MEHFKITVLMSVMFLGFMIGLMSMSKDNTPQTKYTVEQLLDSVEYERARATAYRSEYVKAIVNPAIRLRLAAGIPKDKAITWKQKVIHDLDAVAVARWRPDSLHHYYDEETGTWNKPDSFN